ncbi:MAG: hypothetical protein IT384_29185 [Deltaproteobacteria bacterium]|nr:hypothetical protein [Deltaproteobacteria bacterium]
MKQEFLGRKLRLRDLCAPGPSANAGAMTTRDPGRRRLRPEDRALNVLLKLLGVLEDEFFRGKARSDEDDPIEFEAPSKAALRLLDGCEAAVEHYEGKDVAVRTAQKEGLKARELLYAELVAAITSTLEAHDELRGAGKQVSVKETLGQIALDVAFVLRWNPVAWFRDVERVVADKDIDLVKRTYARPSGRKVGRPPRPSSFTTIAKQMVVGLLGGDMTVDRLTKLCAAANAPEHREQVERARTNRRRSWPSIDPSTGEFQQIPVFRRVLATWVASLRAPGGRSRATGDEQRTQWGLALTDRSELIAFMKRNALPQEDQETVTEALKDCRRRGMGILDVLAGIRTSEQQADELEQCRQVLAQYPEREPGRRWAELHLARIAVEVFSGDSS